MMQHHTPLNSTSQTATIQQPTALIYQNGGLIATTPIPPHSTSQMNMIYQQQHQDNMNINQHMQPPLPLTTPTAVDQTNWAGRPSGTAPPYFHHNSQQQLIQQQFMLYSQTPPPMVPTMLTNGVVNAAMSNTNLYQTQRQPPQHFPTPPNQQPSFQQANRGLAGIAPPPPIRQFIPQGAHVGNGNAGLMVTNESVTGYNQNPMALQQHRHYSTQQMGTAVTVATAANGLMTGQQSYIHAPQIYMVAQPPPPSHQAPPPSSSFHNDYHQTVTQAERQFHYQNTATTGMAPQPLMATQLGNQQNQALVQSQPYALAGHSMGMPHQPHPPAPFLQHNQPPPHHQLPQSAPPYGQQHSGYQQPSKTTRPLSIQPPNSIESEGLGNGGQEDGIPREKTVITANTGMKEPAEGSKGPVDEEANNNDGNANNEQQQKRQATPPIGNDNNAGVKETHSILNSQQQQQAPKDGNMNMEEYHHQYQQSEINTGKWMNGQNGGHLHYSHQQKKSTFNNNDRAAPRFGHEEQNHQFLNNSNQKHHNHHSQPQQNRQNDIYPNPSQKNHQSLLNHNLGYHHYNSNNNPQQQKRSPQDVRLSSQNVMNGCDECEKSTHTWHTCDNIKSEREELTKFSEHFEQHSFHSAFQFQQNMSPPSHLVNVTTANRDYQKGGGEQIHHNPRYGVGVGGGMGGNRTGGYSGGGGGNRASKNAGNYRTMHQQQSKS